MQNFLYSAAFLVVALAGTAFLVYFVELLVDKAESTPEVREDATLLYTSDPGEYPIGSLWEGNVVTAVVPTETSALYRVLGRPSNANQGGAIL